MEELIQEQTTYWKAVKDVNQKTYSANEALMFITDKDKDPETYVNARLNREIAWAFITAADVALLNLNELLEKMMNQ